MKGIGQRVTIGFLSIVVLLSISGVISLFELSNLSYDTEQILSASRGDMVVAKDLWRSAHDHSRAALDVAIFGDTDRKKECRAAIVELEAHLASVRDNAPALVLGCLDTLAIYAAELNAVTEAYGVVEASQQTTPPAEEDFVAEATDTLQVAKPMLVGREWYDKVYEPSYMRFVEQVKRYINLSHKLIAPRAAQLSGNAYRAVTPILISLLVMIAVVLMLYFFVYIYGVKPILRMNRALADFITFKLNYKVKAELIDEIKQLSENIENLINISKLNKKNEENAL